MSKKSIRHDHILTALDMNPSIRVSELSDQLGVSSETVRRDLAELDETGRIKRTYGGAVRTKTFEPALSERSKLHIQERERIAQQALTRIGNADSLFIGGGATTLHFARALRAIERPLTVLTATFSIAMELSTNPLIQVMSLPGIVEPKEGLVHGAETLKCIRQFRTPVAVMGASGIDEDGVSEALLQAAQVYSAMIRHSDEVLILADGSKFGTRSLQQIVGWAEHVTVVTDTQPPPQIVAAIRQRGGDVIWG